MGPTQQLHDPPGGIIQKYRLQAEMTQAALAFAVADITGDTLTAQAVSDWERNKWTPGIANARAVDELLEADGQILEAYGYAPPGPSNQDIVNRIDELEESLKQIVVGDDADDGALSVVLDRMTTALETQGAAIASLARHFPDATPARGVPSPAQAQPAKKRGAPARTRPG